MQYALDAVLTFLFFVVVIGGLLVGLMAAVVATMRSRGAVTQERAYKMWRVRSFILIALGVIYLLTPVQGVVVTHALSSAGAGLFAAGVAMVAGGIVW